MKKIMTLLLMTAMTMIFTGCSNKSNTGNDNVLRVGTEGTFAPYTYHDKNGTLTGFEIDVANAIGEKLGMEVEFVETQWSSMFEALKGGNFDVAMSLIAITDERKQSFDFSTPYSFSKPILIVAADNTDIHSFEDLKGKRAAQALSSNFRGVAESYGASIVAQDEFSLAMECLISGEADAVINDQLTYAYWQSVKGDTESTKVVDVSNDVSKGAVCINKGNEELLGKINQALAELQQDGTLAEISQKYFSTDITKE